MSMAGPVYNCTGSLLRCFLDVQNLLFLIDAAFGAGAMRKLLLVAVGALGEAHSSQKIV
jgi:hypothetical protein